MIKVGDKVIIGNSTLDDPEPVLPKYVGKEGEVIEINKDRPSPITVTVKDIGTDSFWESELGVKP